MSETTHLYTKRNRAGRPHQVWKCETGAEKDVLLFEEVNEGYAVRGGERGCAMSILKAGGLGYMTCVSVPFA